MQWYVHLITLETLFYCFSSQQPIINCEHTPARRHPVMHQRITIILHHSIHAFLTNRTAPTFDTRVCFAQIPPRRHLCFHRSDQVDSRRCPSALHMRPSLPPQSQYSTLPFTKHTLLQSCPRITRVQLLLTRKRMKALSRKICGGSFSLSLRWYC
jgi:hypothetical protein